MVSDLTLEHPGLPPSVCSSAPGRRLWLCPLPPPFLPIPWGALLQEMQGWFLWQTLCGVSLLRGLLACHFHSPSAQRGLWLGENGGEGQIECPFARTGQAWVSLHAGVCDPAAQARLRRIVIPPPRAPREARSSVCGLRAALGSPGRWADRVGGRGPRAACWGCRGGGAQLWDPRPEACAGPTEGWVLGPRRLGGRPRPQLCLRGPRQICPVQPDASLPPSWTV